MFELSNLHAENTEIEFVGFLISGREYPSMSKNIAASKHLAEPSNVSEARSLL